MNVLDTKKRVEIVFHGLNLEDPGRKIRSFKEIISSSSTSADLEFEEGADGVVAGSSSSYQWLIVSRA
jgi:hypothetical protein